MVHHRRFGRIDVLINDAGYGIVGGVEEMPEHELRALLKTNCFGAVAVTQAVLPAMRAQRSGAVVMISNRGGQLSVVGFGAYSASEVALEGTSEALAQKAAPFGIKALVVEPDAFRASFAGGALRHMHEASRARCSSTRGAFYPLSMSMTESCSEMNMTMRCDSSCSTC